jgi:glycosyltransferase involved in cell wall biosynthesis
MPKPHLCFINSLRTWGGAEIWFWETALALRDRGHHISVVAQPDSELRKRCLSENLETFPLAIRFDAAPWTLVKLSRFFLDRKVTAVLTNLTKDLKAGSLAGRLTRVPIILGSRESDFPLKRKNYYRWYFNNLATGLLVNSLATRQTVLQSAPFLDPAKVHLLYKGINLNRFRPGEHGNNSVVGFAGQLIQRKGLATLMKAWDLVEQHHLATLRIAGDGELMPDLLAWRQTLNHPNRVEILGSINGMADFYQGLDMLTMPSLSEGFGLAAAEAQACALPVIATRTSSLPEIVTHGVTGLLVPVDDPAALAEAIGKLLENPDLARKMGRAGLGFVQKNFDREDTLDRLEELTGLDSTNI